MGPRLGVVAILAITLLGSASARFPPVDAPADVCQTCLVSVRILEDFLCDPAATDFLVDFVEKQVCPAMGNTEQCHNLAEGLLPTLIQWFRASATPASLCSSAGVCGGAKVALSSIPELNRPALRVRDTAECAMCEFVVGQVKAALNGSDALERLREAALQVCAGLPAQLADSCADFVNTYEPLMAELIEDMDPDTVCGLLGVCVEAWAAVPPPPLPAGLMRQLAGTKALCRPPPPHLAGLLPPLVSLQLQAAPRGGNLLADLFRGAMQHLGLGRGPRHEPRPEHEEAEIGPQDMPGLMQDQAVQALQGSGMTGPAHHEHEHEHEHGEHAERHGEWHGEHHGEHGGGMMGGRAMREGGGMMGEGPMMAMMGGGAANDACDYCRMAVIEAHSLVSNPSVQAEMLNYTLTVCDSFPSFAVPCKAYVAMYAPLVFQLLEQYLVPDTVCAQTGMCPPPPAAAVEQQGQQQQGEEGSAAAFMQLGEPAHPHMHEGGPMGWVMEKLGGLMQAVGLAPHEERELEMPTWGGEEDELNVTV